MMITRALIAILVLGHSIAAFAASQEKPKPPEAPAAPEAPRTGEGAKVDKPTGSSRGPRPSQLRAQVVVTRFQGERKVSSAPYSFVVAVDVPQRTRVKMGVEVPVSVAQLPTADGAKSGGPFTSFQYRNVGTNLDCGAQFLGDGLYQLRLTVENSSIYQGPDSPAAVGARENTIVPDRPLFRSFSVEMNPILRDGESVQTVASTDPVTGEVVKIDLTVNVVK